MASKSIDIKIGSTFNADGVLAANKGLAKLAQDVKAANDEMRQATMRAEMAVNSYAENADKAVRAMGGGYKTLEQQLAELSASHQTVGEKAVAAGNSGVKAFNPLALVTQLLHGNFVAAAKALESLGGVFGKIGQIGPAALGAVGMAVTSLISMFKAAKDLVVTAFNLNQPSEDVKAMANRFAAMNNEAEQFKFNLDEAEKSASKQAKLFEDEANAIAKMTKAQNEFNRAQELSAAKTDEQKAAINSKWDSANAEAEEQAAQSIRDSRREQLNGEELRLRDALSAARKRQREYREAGRNGAAGWTDGYWAEQENIDEATAKLEANSHAQEMLDREEEVAEKNIETRKQKELNAAAEAAAKKEAADRKAAEEKAKVEAAAAKKAEDERLRAVEAEKKAREKMEAELHAQRVANAKSEVEASKQAASAATNTASRAQTEFDRAFGMYRSADHGAAQIAEERDYAADYKQLQKDAIRYGGKWRIDELASLMEAGDTKGQAAKLEEWRKSSSFTPEVESMVRAAAADQTKTTAEDELRKINENTKNLADKLDQLLQVK